MKAKATTPQALREANRNRQRLKRYRDASKLHSGFVSAGGSNRVLDRQFRLVARKVYHCYLNDTLKSPMACNAKPAYFSKPAVNVYFGANVSEDGDTVERAVYGFGSGRKSIGLDPRTKQMHPMFSEMLDLMDIAMEMVRRNPRWRRQMKG